MSNVVACAFFFLVFFSSSLICPKSAANSFVFTISPKTQKHKNTLFRFDTKSNALE